VQTKCSQPALQQWTSVATSDSRLTDLELWLAQPGGVCRLINRRPGHGLAPAVGEGGSLAVLAGTGDTFAYFNFGPADGGGQREIGINAHGPRAAGLVERVAGRVRAWAADRPRLTTWIELYPIGVPVPSLDDMRGRSADRTLGTGRRSSHAVAYSMRPDRYGNVSFILRDGTCQVIIRCEKTWSI
jgi:hypothetical protein